MPTFGSLFAGIGGIDLGLERAGWTGRWQVEWDPYCQRVLEKHWPGLPRYGDITTVDWSGVEPVDLLAGGFPCQPVSAAGKRKAQGDERWLWPEFLRAIRALRPSYILVENVTNLLAINGGSAFGEVVGGLAESGYDGEWDCVPAAAVGALHERDRVWIVAYPNRDGRDAAGRWQEGPEGAALGSAVTPGEHGRAYEFGPLRGTIETVAYTDIDDVERTFVEPRIHGGSWTSRRRPMADPDSERREGERQRGLSGDGDASRGDDADRRRGAVPHADGSDAQGQLRSGDDAQDRRQSRQRPLGLFSGGWGDREWEVEPDVGRVAHGVPARVDRLRALGNAVVPQVVEVIGQRLLEVIEAERAA